MKPSVSRLSARYAPAASARSQVSRVETCRISVNSAHHLSEPADGLFDVLAAVERAQAEVAFAAGSEAAARSADEVGLREQAVEEIPARFVAGGLDPDVGGVDAAVDLDSRCLQSFADQPGILEIIVDDRPDLRLSLGAVDRLRGPLHGI